MEQTEIEKALEKIFSNKDIEIFTRIVGKGNSSGHVYIPKKYIGKLVKIIILDVI